MYWGDISIPWAIIYTHTNNDEILDMFRKFVKKLTVFVERIVYKNFS